MNVLKILVIFLLATSCFSQSIYGTWENKQYNISMTLNQDGSFNFSGPNGKSSGIWGAQGSVFQMQDENGQLYQYSIAYFDQANLNLLDVNGMALNYQRSALSASKIYADVNGMQLTDQHIQTGVGIIQFVIGQRIKSSEIDELIQTSIPEFNTNPQEFIRQMDGLQQSLNIMQTLQDPLQIGTMRQMLIAEFYKATRTMYEHEKPLLIQIINRYVKVMAYDEVNNLALTDSDINAMINYVEFSNQLSGLQGGFSAQERVQYSQQLVNEFGAAPLEQKQFLCSASLAWTLVNANWQNMNQMQQNQIQQNYAGQMTQQPQYNNSNGQNITQQDIDKLRRENMANQNMFNMMNNMSMQNHATMLNTIENFGGTGNYWEVTDMGY